MEGIHFFESAYWSLESFFGYESSFLRVNKETVLYTWAVIIFLIILITLIRYFFNYSVVVRQMTISFFQMFIDLTQQSIGAFVMKHCFFVMTLFLFIFFSNVLSLIPFLDEPTRDLNTTVALGLITFFYVQAVDIKTHGILSYVSDYFRPIFIMLPLNILSKLASVMSLSIRLFGNIFGGSMITGLYFFAIKTRWWAEILGIITGFNFLIILFFTIFEGFLQAFVFTILSLTYISLSMNKEGH